MTQTKLKERFENAVDAFFAKERNIEDSLDQNYGFAENVEVVENSLNNFEMNAMTYGASEVSEKEWSLAFQIFRQVFLFFPATFVLWVTTIEWVTFTANGSLETTPWVAYAGMFIASLLTILGVGDIRNPKHWVIPASIMAVGAILGLVFFLLPFDAPRVIGIGGLLYFLPLALIAPFIAKFWVDGIDEEI